MPPSDVEQQISEILEFLGLSGLSTDHSPEEFKIFIAENLNAFLKFKEEIDKKAKLAVLSEIDVKIQQALKDSGMEEINKKRLILAINLRITVLYPLWKLLYPEFFSSSKTGEKRSAGRSELTNQTPVSTSTGIQDSVPVDASGATTAASSAQAAAAAPVAAAAAQPQASQAHPQQPQPQPQPPQPQPPVNQPLLTHISFSAPKDITPRVHLGIEENDVVFQKRIRAGGKNPQVSYWGMKYDFNSRQIKLSQSYRQWQENDEDYKLRMVQSLIQFAGQKFASGANHFDIVTEQADVYCAVRDWLKSNLGIGDNQIKWVHDTTRNNMAATPISARILARAQGNHDLQQLLPLFQEANRNQPSRAPTNGMFPPPPQAAAAQQTAGTQQPPGLRPGRR